MRQTVVVRVVQKFTSDISLQWFV